MIAEPSALGELARVLARFGATSFGPSFGLIMLAGAAVGAPAL